MSLLIGCVGALAMAVFPWLLAKDDRAPILAIFGLALLTIQQLMLDNPLWNLVGLNLISIGGFAYALYIRLRRNRD
tara:strand:- start:515 stop:742 length:228 start_codon:yes stop_codon:yes gene_type:complete